jgi:hypothetical protein
VTISSRLSRRSTRGRTQLQTAVLLSQRSRTERLNGGAEIRDISQHGHGIYTDNGRSLRIAIFQPARLVELTTWQAADVDLLDASASIIYTTQLPSSVRGARLESPARDLISWVVIRAHSEFLLLSMCIEA